MKAGKTKKTLDFTNLWNLIQQQQPPPDAPCRTNTTQRTNLGKFLPAKLSNIYEISWFNPGQTMPQHLYNHSDNLILCTELTVSSLNTDFRAGMKLCSFFLTILFIKFGKDKRTNYKELSNNATVMLLNWSCDISNAMRQYSALAQGPFYIVKYNN